MRLTPALLVLLCACTPWPVPVDRAAAAKGTAPVILLLDDVLAAAAVTVTPPGTAGSVSARAAALQARAAAMRGPVTDAATRDRLADAVAN